MKRATVIPSSLSISLISSFCCCWSPEEGVTGSGVKVKSLDGWRRRGTDEVSRPEKTLRLWLKSLLPLEPSLPPAR